MFEDRSKLQLPGFGPPWSIGEGAAPGYAPCPGKWFRPSVDPSR